MDGRQDPLLRLARRALTSATKAAAAAGGGAGGGAATAAAAAAGGGAGGGAAAAAAAGAAAAPGCITLAAGPFLLKGAKGRGARNAREHPPSRTVEWPW